MTEKLVSTEEERIAALLGLAATKPGPAEQCPPPELLSAFIEGRAPLSQRKAVTAHLNRCEQCYREWLEVALTTAETQPAQTPAVEWAWWRRLRELWHVRPSLIPLTAALAMTVAVVAIVFQKPPAQQDWQMSRLAAVVQQHPGLEQALAALPGDSAFAFSDPGQDPARQAFSEGFRQARRWFEHGAVAEPSRSEPWQDSPWRDYYELGQWAMLTWALAHAEDVTAEEWEIFNRHCQHFISRLEQNPEAPGTGQVLKSLREIHALLGALEQQADPTQQARLTRRLRLTIRQLLI